MSGLVGVSLPRWEVGGVPSGALVADVRRWVTSAPLRELVRLFGGRFPDVADPDLLVWLDDFTERHWDFRGGGERDQLVEPALAPEVEVVVRSAVAALGLDHGVPPRSGRYDHLVVLGGLASSCLARVRAAEALVRGGGVEVGEIVLLGSRRPLGEREVDFMAEAGHPGLRDESEAIEAAARAVFDIGEPESHDFKTFEGDDGHLSWSAKTFRADGYGTVRSYCAPSTSRARRADTSDTLAYWRSWTRLDGRQDVLLVTTSLYVPFQHCDAIATLGLPTRCGIDTVGASGPAPLSVPRYLQEIRSAVHSMNKLCLAVGPLPT